MNHKLNVVIAAVALAAATQVSAQEVVKTNVSLESQGLPNVYGA